MTPDQVSQFHKDGFAIVENVLTPEQVAALRVELFKMFDTPSTAAGDFDRRGRLGSVRFDVCSRNPSLRWLLTHPPLLAALRGLLGDDFVFLPEMSAHHAGYGDWHKDTTSQERAGQRFQWEPDYLMVEAALYLQSNSDEFGGGLEVNPGSHRLPDRFIDIMDRTPLDKVRTKLKSWGVIGTEKGYSIPSKAGNLVLFDFRLDHKASSATAKEIPRDKQKLAIFFACSRNNAHATKYMNYILARPDYTFLKGHTYPTELQQLTSQARVNLLSVAQ